MLRKSPCNLQELFWCSRILPAICRRLSGVPESFLQLAADFLVFRNPSCNLQQTFWCSGILPADCRELSDVPETFLQITGRFRGTDAGKQLKLILRPDKCQF